MNVTLNRAGITIRSRFSACGAAALLTSLQLTSGSARADEPASSADTAAARDLAIEGLKLADADKCADAIDKLARAEKLHHSPIVLGRLGECLISQGKIVDGTEDLQRMLHEPLPENPPANLSRARDRAQAALSGAKTRIAYLTITIRGATKDISVTVDGEPVPEVLLDRGRPTDPGEHLIKSSAPGYLEASRHVTIGAGEKLGIALQLNPNPNASTEPAAPPTVPSLDAPAKIKTEPAPQPAAAPAPKTQAVEASSSSGATGYWLMGLGGLAAVTGGVFGYLALDQKKQLDGKCPNNACIPSAQGTFDRANQYAKASTILAASGAGVFTIGLTISLLSGQSTGSEHPPSARAHAYFGPDRIGIAGAF